MTDQFRDTTKMVPITPPPELVREWLGAHFGTTVTGEVSDVELALATQAARWGGDQELEAILALAGKNPEIDRYFDGFTADWIRRDRRPKPPSLKDLALGMANTILNDRGRLLEVDTREALELSRRALEALSE